MTRRRNSDEALRRAERVATRDADRVARARLIAERRRAGELVCAFDALDVEDEPRERFRLLGAAISELPGYDTIEADYRAERARIEEAGMIAMREANPRVARSRRATFEDLAGWAEEIDSAGAGRVAGEFRARLEDARERAMNRGAAARDMRAALDVLRHRVAWDTEPLHGDQALEYYFSSPSTYSTQGYGADGYARRAAEDKAIFLASQGFDSRIERVPGERRDSIDYRGRPTTITVGDGYRVIAVGVREPLDTEILRLRDNGWTYTSHIFGHNALEQAVGEERARELTRKWTDERFNGLHWDPSSSRPRECCPMTVDRMRAIVAERGLLRPSWLGMLEQVPVPAVGPVL